MKTSDSQFERAQTARLRHNVTPLGAIGRNLLLLLFCLVGLAACLPADCPTFAPLASGSVMDHGAADQSDMVATSGKVGTEGKTRSWKLSPSQLTGLSAWLAARNSGWQDQMPSPLPAMVTILLKHEDGRVSQISMFVEQASWQTTLQIFSKGGDGAIFRGEYNLSKKEFLDLMGPLREGAGGRES